MANILDYIKWRGDLSIKQDGFNEIDNLVLSRFSYLPFDNLIGENETVTIKELSERFKKKDINDMNILWEDDTKLFPLMGSSKRFGEMKATKYVNIVNPEEEKQFSAITVLIPDDTIYVSFRGTDNTIVGWKEDFNMSFKGHVVSQKDAVKYLDDVAKEYPNMIRVGGHSKGGNLAVYAATFANDYIKSRIIAIYNNDGPGFNDEIVETEEYKNMIERVPQLVEDVKDILTNFENGNQDISTTINNYISENEEKINTSIQEILKTIISYVGEGVKNFFSQIVDMVIAFVFSIYILANKEKLQKTLKKVVVAYLPKDKQKETFKNLDIGYNSFYNYMSGQAKDAVILGILCMIGMLILRIPYAFLIGIITMVTALVPIVGAWFSGILGFLLIASVSPIKAIVFVIFIIILQQVDNHIIYPKVVGNVIKLPSMLVLVAITVGGKLFGILGIVLGVPITSMIYIIFKENTKQRIRAKDKVEA